jgi:two-component system, NtrC family, sensor kinase
MSVNEEWYNKDFHEPSEKDKRSYDRKRYRRLLKYSIFTTSFVAIAPLIVMAVINFYQYRQAYETDIIYPISRQTSNIKNSLESFINERRSALGLIIREKNYQELSSQDKLASTLRHLKESFDGFVDLGLINSNGDQVAYIGPYNLQGKNYSDQDWFHEVSIKGTYISSVFMGFRSMPHFVIAIIHENQDGGYYILRATIDSDMLYRKILSQNILASSDAFLIDKNGILQTPSKHQGKILDTVKFNIPDYSERTEVTEIQSNGQNIILGYAFIANTPFILIETTFPESIMEHWVSTRNNLIGMVVIFIILILIVVIWISTRMVSHIRQSDQKRMRILHEISYTNKMASIGRLAAGVSHEINNPLAIIGENAGIIMDILTFSDGADKKDKIIKHLNSITNSVERCSKITHRLLGFAKRMEAKIENINVYSLVEEVVGFIQREAKIRNVNIHIDHEKNIPDIESDRGQLQQVILNIVNNALDAVPEGGYIKINIEQVSKDFIQVAIADNGPGIPKSDLDRIFEPFYTTKKESGTGLGLSITYGIIQKLGGTIDVKSKLDGGTTFFIRIPIIYTQREG